VKISLLDKYEALRRHPGYCKDWEAWQRISGTVDDEEFEAATAKLKAKYHVPKLPSPLKHSIRPRIKNRPSPIEVIPSIQVNETALITSDTTPTTFSFHGGHRFTVDAFLGERRYLYLKVDLEESLSTMKTALKDIVKKWKAYLPIDGKSNERLGKTTVDPWNVYDLHTLYGKSLLAIAKELFGINKNPAYDLRADAQYRQVKWALEKAKKMIKTIRA